MKVLVAIDPGASGGIAWRDGTGRICAIKMPDTPADILSHLLGLEASFGLLEKVGGYMPGNSAPAAVKFARHCGHLDMAFLALKIPHTRVAPQVWMKKILTTVPPEKKDRKNAIKAEMQRRYPDIKVTLDVADALGLLTYLVENDELFQTSL